MMKDTRIPRAIGIIGDPLPGEIEIALGIIQGIKEGLDAGTLVLDEPEMEADIVFRHRSEGE
jgi:hypothetical protein